MLFLMLLVARWFNIVWFGILRTLLSSFIRVAAFNIGLLKKPGKAGGFGSLSIALTAYWYACESSAWSKSMRYFGIWLR